MSKNEEAIYDFQDLKEFLIKRGYVVKSRDPWVVVKPDEVTPDQLAKGDIRFENTGIFVKDKSGRDIQVFLYKRDYHLQTYGKPKFHICRCRTIDEFILSGGFNDHYMRTNTDPVIVANMDNEYIDEEVDRLPLCKNCSKIISQYNGMDSADFVKILKAARGMNDEVELDIFGYTKDWEKISRAYREKYHYTCEKCGLKIDDDYDRQYIHVHHINGDKKNNQDNNLQCLCLYCHAHTSEHHLKRLTTGANRIIYEDFIEKYGER